MNWKNLSYARNAIVAASVAIAVASAAAAGKAPDVSAQVIFANKCASCHGETFDGRFGPRLKGKAFYDRWAPKGRAALASYIKATMPPANPGSLPASEADALARLLSQVNGLPVQASVAAVPVVAGSQNAGLVNDGFGEEARDFDLLGKPNIDVQYSQEMNRREALLEKLSPITDFELIDPSSADWPSWRRGSNTQGYSPLKQIDRKNVGQLSLAWVTSLAPGTNGIAPLVHDGVMFINVSGKVMALDAASGAVLWEYSGSEQNTGGIPLSQPRTMALYGEKLYVPTLDGHLVALASRTGKVIWDHELFKPETNLQMTTGPVIAHGKVIQGVAGCSLSSSKCFIAALDAETGQESWRFYTIASDDSWNGAEMDERTGASVWTPGTYDPELNLVYFGIGQTYRVKFLLQPNKRSGASNDALYTDSTLALDPDTGKLVWHYQHFPADVWDMDWAFERTLMTVPTPKGERKIVLTGGKIAIFDALDAKTGQYLFSFDLGMQNLVKSIDPVTGRKEVNVAARTGAGASAKICPDSSGARNWPATAYDPHDGLLFISMRQNCGMIGTTPEGVLTHMAVDKPEAHGMYGYLVAYDMKSRRIAWTKDSRAPQISAVLATAGGLVFDGTSDHTFRARDSRTGETLWQVSLNDMPNGFPITYAIGKEQYIAIVAGGGTPLSVTAQAKTLEFGRSSGARTLWTFKLNRIHKQ